jgi:alkylation response protein AidB-like acyl-CoA dehydrogenase
MEFNISRENQMVRDAIRDWVFKECPRDKIEEWDSADKFPESLSGKLSRLGFCAMTVSEDHGGEGRNIQGACIVAEQIAARFQPLAKWYTHQAFFGGLLIEAMGDDSQKRVLLPDCVEGRLLVTPSGIDDSQTPLATFQTDGTGPKTMTFSLTGESAYVTLADQAKRLLIPATTDMDNRTDPTTIFLVATDRPGVSITPVEKIGCRGARYCKVELNDVALDNADILGGESARCQGGDQWQRILDISRLVTAAEALGLARGAFEYTLDYARQRVQFGQAIGKFTALRNRFSEMACDIDAATLLLARAAWRADNDMAYHREAAVARIKAGDVALRCAMEGLQIFGGYGYMMEYDIQRYVRDAAGLAAASDGEEAARESIGGLLGL